MQNKNLKNYLGAVVALGAVWGLSEAAVGMGLRQCAAFVSGSIMTGVALFFMAAGWVVSRRVLGVFLLVLIAAGFKVFDALLLSLPLNHGAIGNPIFAFVMEGAAFLLIVAVLQSRLRKKLWGQAALGGLAALLAVNLFPLVRFATGVPACVVAGTGYPLSLYYSHIAVLLSLVTVPLGFWVGARVEAFTNRMAETIPTRRFQYILPPAAVAVCLGIILLIRLT